MIFVCSLDFIFKDILKIFVLLIGKDPRKDMVPTELTHLLWFLRKNQVTARGTLND